MECVDTLTAMGLHEVCNDFIEETKLYHRDPYIVHKLRKLSFRPRRLIPCAVAVGGFTGKEHSTNRCVNLMGMSVKVTQKESHEQKCDTYLRPCFNNCQFRSRFQSHSWQLG